MQRMQRYQRRTALNVGERVTGVGALDSNIRDDVLGVKWSGVPTTLLSSVSSELRSWSVSTEMGFKRGTNGNDFHVE